MERVTISAYILLVSFLLITAPGLLLAQDPALPPSNYSLTNALDGSPPSPGSYYLQYVQYYQANSIRDANNRRVGDAKIKSMLFMQQFAHISRSKLLGGNPGFAVLQPLVAIHTSGQMGETLTSNPSVMGDLIVGAFVQWFNKKVLAKDFSHRLELSAVLPTGAYNTRYLVNPGSNLFSVVPHYTFTYSLSSRFSISQRHHFNYHFANIDTHRKPGSAYNMNYSFDFLLAKTFRLSILGYYIQQLSPDSYKGDSKYFQKQYGISNTKERAFSFGPGISYITTKGIFLELKTVFETAVYNRPQGTRTTFRFNYQF